MKKPYIITTSILIAVVLLLGIGVVQDYFNNPYRNCVGGDGGSGYQDYTCKDGSGFLTK